LQEAEFDAEMARQPAPVRAIKTGMTSPKFIVRVELMEMYEFSERYLDIIKDFEVHEKEESKTEREEKTQRWQE